MKLENASIYCTSSVFRSKGTILKEGQASDTNRYIPYSEFIISFFKHNAATLTSFGVIGGVLVGLGTAIATISSRFTTLSNELSKERELWEIECKLFESKLRKEREVRESELKRVKAETQSDIFAKLFPIAVAAEYDQMRKSTPEFFCSKSELKPTKEE